MQTNRELIKEVDWSLSQAESGLDRILEILDQNPALKESVFGGAKCDLEIGLKGARQWLDELEERSKELDHLQVIEIRETTTISR